MVPNGVWGREGFVTMVIVEVGMVDWKFAVEANMEGRVRGWAAESRMARHDSHGYGTAGYYTYEVWFAVVEGDERLDRGGVAIGQLVQGVVVVGQGVDRSSRNSRSQAWAPVAPA